MTRIFVKFYGFSDAERHALATVFRLSESHEVAYSAWMPQATGETAEPDILLIDGDSWEAVLELAKPEHDTLKLIWVGEAPPLHAWRVFAAPVRWSAVLEALDAEFAPLTSQALSADLALSDEHDLDVVLDEADDNTQPAGLEGDAEITPPRRVLLVDASRDDRLYLRAKLAAAGLHEVDEAATGAQALVLLNTDAYHLVTVDLGLTDMDPWQLIKAVDSTRPAIAHLFVTGTAPGWQTGLRARFSGAEVYLRKPLHPGQLKDLLQKI
ncbi:response regulator [Polaromonas sp.]|uniref:response regulator n=1 Tax=Polaromonas sp. TaxID=1869339 RepID=UPI00273206B3|nr:response regulator [Polaromonas sp.]MDP1741815.1 response regulator [Polaromonas sp.]